jgi:hypothetical protein
MKRIFRTLLVLSIASMTVVTSCKKDDEEIKDATLTVTPASTSITSGEVVALTVEAVGNDDNKLSEITVTSSASTTPIVDNQKLSGATYTTVVRDTPTTTGSIVYTVTVKAAKNTVTQNVTVNVVGLDSDNPIIGNQASSSPKFWASSTKQIYTLAQVKATPALAATIDIGYVTRSIANGGNKLIAPASQDATDIYKDQWSDDTEDIDKWTVRNNTMFKSITVDNTAWTAATTDAQIAALINTAKSGGDPTASSLAVIDGAFALFKTAAGRYGIIQVVDAEGQINSTTLKADPGDAQLLIKYQK